MFYVVVKQSPHYHQMTIDELLFGSDFQDLITPNTSNTRTYEVEKIGNTFMKNVSFPYLKNVLKQFNEETKSLREVPRKELYYEFHIPKKSGGLRKIDAPRAELMEALRKLKHIFEDDFKALYHTSAFAYVKNRNTIECLKRHQENESKWFGKYDLSNFFGSTTIDFVIKMFDMIFPFSHLDAEGKMELHKALKLAFLDGGLPQGTPISPTITNIMMIPIDYKLANDFRSFRGNSFVYTRYADDFQISSKTSFDYRDVEKHISDTLKNFGADFQINAKKTMYGSSAGRNWNLGLMLNQNNQITVGSANKRRLKSMVNNYVNDRKGGVEWELTDVQTLLGTINYYKMVEGEIIDALVNRIGVKYGIDVIAQIKTDLKA